MILTEKNYYRQSFAKLSLENETLQEIKFEECEFRDCGFIGCKFDKCRFIGCKFERCILSAVILTGSRFTDVNFQSSKVIGLDWTQAAYIQDMTFNKCQVNYSNFRLLKLPKLKINDCEAKEADFTEANLCGGDLSRTDFEKSIFFKTNLNGANFKEARNYYIDARQNMLKKTIFSLPEALSLLTALDIIIE